MKDNNLEKTVIEIFSRNRKFDLDVHAIWVKKQNFSEALFINLLMMLLDSTFPRMQLNSQLRKEGYLLRVMIAYVLSANQTAFCSIYFPFFFQGVSPICIFPRLFPSFIFLFFSISVPWPKLISFKMDPFYWLSVYLCPLVGFLSSDFQNAHVSPDIKEAGSTMGLTCGNSRQPVGEAHDLTHPVCRLGINLLLHAVI